MPLKGKNALVTGAGRRGGREVALALGRARFDVAIHYHTSRRGAAAVMKRLRRMGVRVQAFRADLSRFREVMRLARQVERTFGPVDLLVNNAADFIRTPLAKITERDWSRTLDTNLKAPFFLARELGLRMKKRGEGVIVNIADWAVEDPYPSYLPYIISKAGIVSMTKGLAKVLGPEVRVMALAPRVLKNFHSYARAVVRLATSHRPDSGEPKSGATYSVDGQLLGR